MVVGADHGVGALRGSVKIILRSKDNDVLKSYILQFCYIDCKKDTYEILKNTISKSANSALHRIVKGGNILHLKQYKHIQNQEVT